MPGSSRYTERSRASGRRPLAPKDSVRQRPGGFSVFVVETGKVREVSFPRTGRNVDTFVEVPGGYLKAGMSVVVQGNENLRGGMPVRVRKGRNAPSIPAAGRSPGKKKGRQG